ncbi:hypothetical protein EJ05DRAFT_138033 [Pseudovirgaria hyperparasitica]|uniref:Uncharacterized protein n=1 Tax=Pseudovirgaria hyperparasitica TaxID=470096 RepID=A0A6A6VYI6_9PEZI|nr:uncharacterized protein EJ05DRAFT_138033 [Pseudovirgaria hyperparasitica]KAF2754919.1 hypothetical protein EJ05DRAFT_138033 [Pseudovirgaria hyperparasitica]
MVRQSAARWQSAPCAWPRNVPRSDVVQASCWQVIPILVVGITVYDISNFCVKCDASDPTATRTSRRMKSLSGERRQRKKRAHEAEERALPAPVRTSEYAMARWANPKMIRCKMAHLQFLCVGEAFVVTCWHIIIHCCAKPKPKTQLGALKPEEALESLRHQHSLNCH